MSVCPRMGIKKEDKCEKTIGVRSIFLYIMMYRVVGSHFSVSRRNQVIATEQYFSVLKDIRCICHKIVLTSES